MQALKRKIVALIVQTVVANAEEVRVQLGQIKLKLQEVQGKEAKLLQLVLKQVQQEAEVLNSFQKTC